MRTPVCTCAFRSGFDGWAHDDGCPCNARSVVADDDGYLYVSTLTKIAVWADYLSTEGESGGIRIDSWVSGFTPDEIALLRRLHGRVY